MKKCTRKQAVEQILNIWEKRKTQKLEETVKELAEGLGYTAEDICCSVYNEAERRSH